MRLYNDFYSYNAYSLYDCKYYCEINADCYACSYWEYYSPNCYFYTQDFSYEKYIGWQTYSLVILSVSNSSFIRDTSKVVLYNNVMLNYYAYKAVNALSAANCWYLCASEPSCYATTYSSGWNQPSCYFFYGKFSFYPVDGVTSYSLISLDISTSTTLATTQSQSTFN